MHKVLNDFKEKSHGNTIYRKGETYPKPGYNADAKRVEFLQSVHPVYKIAFLAKEEQKKAPVPKKTTRKVTEKPVEKSGEEA